MKDRSTIIDLTLAFASIFVITLAIWPRTETLQVIAIRDTDDQWTEYCIASLDPLVAEIELKLNEWSQIESNPTYVKAKWQSELAEFYSNGAESKQKDPSIALAHHHEKEAADLGPATATLSDSVATVGFENAGEGESESQPTNSNIISQSRELNESGDADGTERGGKVYWNSVHQSAEATIASLEFRAGNPPLRLESKIGPQFPQLAFHFAFLFGIAAACGYRLWGERYPVAKGLDLESQHVYVLTRLGTAGGIVALAFISAITIWL